LFEGGSGHAVVNGFEKSRKVEALLVGSSGQRRVVNDGENLAFESIWLGAFLTRLNQANRREGGRARKNSGRLED